MNEADTRHLEQEDYNDYDYMFSINNTYNKNNSTTTHSIYKCGHSVVIFITSEKPLYT